MWAPTLKVPKVKFSRKSPEIGQDLLYVGAPKGIYHPPTVPIFKGTFSGDINAAAALVTFPATGGSSGSAVLNEENRIIGVVFAANRDFHHVSLITSHKSFLLFIKQARIKFSNIRL